MLGTGTSHTHTHGICFLTLNILKHMICSVTFNLSEFLGPSADAPAHKYVASTAIGSSPCPDRGFAFGNFWVAAVAGISLICFANSKWKHVWKRHFYEFRCMFGVEWLWFEQSLSPRTGRNKRNHKTRHWDPASTMASCSQYWSWHWCGSGRVRHGSDIDLVGFYLTDLTASR